MAVLRFIYALYLRLTGLGLLGMVLGYFGLKLAAEAGGQTIPSVELWVQATLAALGLFLLIPWWLPRGLRRPTQGRDLIWLSVHGIIVITYPKLLAAMMGALIVLPDVPSEIAIAAQQDQASPSWSLVVPAVLMFLLVLPSLRGQKPLRPDPKDPARAIPVQPKTPVPAFNQKLPAIGGAMKLYVGADWLILRLLGLGLMGTAYMLWGLIASGRIGKAEQLSFGNDPTRAMYAYAAIGAIIALPFLLPGRISAPRHVGFGLVKAVILVAVAFVLITPLDVAIDMFTPDMYHPTLHATVPKLFKAIAGIAVTSVLLIAFFRQLNTLPAVDYKGDPKVALSQKQLYALRQARMGQP